jgi:hypothetical protein
VEFREEAKCQIMLFQLPDTVVSGLSLTFHCHTATGTVWPPRSQKQMEGKVKLCSLFGFQRTWPALHALEQLHILLLHYTFC